MRRPLPLRALPLALVLGLGLLGSPAGGPEGVAAVGPLPECRLDDIFTEPRGYEDWATTQVDWILSLGPKYKPKDLVSVSRAGVAGGGQVRELVIKDLEAMADAARANGTPIKVLSPFRGYNQQVDLFNSYAGWTGKRYTNFDNAVTFSARPGHSEHQTGLTIDFGSIGDTGLTSNWEVTPAGGWMARNAWKYGWLMSYPDGKQDLVCYRYEPWHYRYVGRDLAAKIHESGLTIREYLWANYTQVDPACVALPPPKLKTPGTPRSCAFAEASPSPPSTGPPATGSIAPSLPVASIDVSAIPTGVPSPSPAGALDRALPIGIAVVLGVLALFALGMWQLSRRRARWRR